MDGKETLTEQEEMDQDVDSDAKQELGLTELEDAALEEVDGGIDKKPSASAIQGLDNAGCINALCW